MHFDKGDKIMTYTPNTYKYKMSKVMAKDLLSNRKGEEAKMHPQDFLCKVVNEEYGLKGTCIEVIFY